ncbi:hypothetical protein [Aureispira anguillae]|uniref:Outer membrane protein beta-barrel domain-containing protein n=1 Tax=Aureispira anguillae TaxID=2864201 RepID=A0A916DUB7_9BACT|nr:hypothetical protein [Aureispira anguillae]BDS12116.1 hypothetical protein AsAng_0028310 [Aureispira anguillae]
MKKKILLALLVLSVLSTQAQDDDNAPLTGKKGQAVLPTKGDIGLGINMIPFFYWLGNSFNGTSNNTYASDDKFFSIFGNAVIIGKYMLTDKSALRLAWGINFGHSEKEKYVRDDASNLPNAMVKDVRSLDWSRASLAIGYEMRKGKRRLQGFFGGDIRLTYNQNSDFRYSYGNGYSLANIVPTSYNWGNNINGNRRKTMDTGLNVLGVGLRAFVGAEYFFAPKVCIGAEFGWGVMYRHTLAVTVTEEYYEPSTEQIISENVYTPAINSFSAGIDNLDGTVYLMFYFDSRGNGKGGAKNKTAKKKTSKKEQEKKIKPFSGNNRF